MTEIGELFAAPYVHEEPEEDCPFCPREEPEEFRTYPGAKNDSRKLAAIMEDPSSLTARQPGARPKDGGANRQSESRSQPKPNPIYHHPEHGDYSCEAHHALSGNQAMKGHAIEAWICADRGKIEKDTGYSINNAENGVWLPSIPETSKRGRWGPLSYEEKKRIAFAVMEAGKGQFHKGPHDITDPEDPFGDYHESYPLKLGRLLLDLDELIIGWVSACYACEDVDSETGPFYPNWKLHNMLDSLSKAIARDLRADPCSWEYFISRVALDYHTPRCKHRYAVK